MSRLQVELSTQELIKIVQRGSGAALSEDLYNEAKAKLEEPFEELDGAFIVAKNVAEGYDNTQIGKVNWTTKKLELSWRSNGKASNTTELYWLEMLFVLKPEVEVAVVEMKEFDFPPFDGLTGDLVIRPSRLIGAALAVIHDAETTMGLDAAASVSETVMKYIGLLSGANGPITPEIMTDEMDWDDDQRTQAAVYAHACWYTGTIHEYPGGKDQFIEDLVEHLFKDDYDYPGKAI